jgi:hypothetical protein
MMSDIPYPGEKDIHFITAPGEEGKPLVAICENDTITTTLVPGLLVTRGTYICQYNGIDDGNLLAYISSIICKITH